MISALVFAIAGAVGFLIGAVGVGGVLLIPSLVLIGGLSVHQAAATALSTFLATGIVGTWLFARRGSIEWAVAGPICVGATVFAFLGAWGNVLVDPDTLLSAIAAVVALSGVNIMLQFHRKAGESAAPRRNRAALIGLGAICGLGSGMTGAGGPLFSVPLMLLMGFAPLTTFGTAQALQIASAGAGSIGNLLNANVDFRLALALTAAELLGLYGGFRLAHFLNPSSLRLLAGAACLVCAVVIAVRLFA